ncbi:MAG TPA: GDP-mannose 4,6-dehydratase [Xanthobacteraceae bacterium]|nr:GDP-mannose 4,6-dehydratase [Xanthobacteraceae bacterium]
MSRTALITGVSGQDGAYLARLLLSKGYRVVGATRPSASSSFARLEYLGIAREVEPYDCEMLELSNIVRMIERVKPDEVYNLAAQSFVGASFQLPIFTMEVNAHGTVRLLEAMRLAAPGARFYQASTSEMFGNAPAPQHGSTPFHPRSPYGVAKMMAHNFAVNYREAYGMFCASGILFNHESPLRGHEFVTRHITVGLAGVKHGRRDHLALGNLDARRDWGFADDYVEGMWRMLQQDTASDFVLATGVATSVRRFVELAAAHFGFAIAWSGKGVDEIGTDTRSGRVLVRIDPRRHRPAEVHDPVGAPKNAAEKLGWRHTTDVAGLAAMMAAEDDRRVRDGVAAY